MCSFFVLSASRQRYQVCNVQSPKRQYKRQKVPQHLCIHNSSLFLLPSSTSSLCSAIPTKLNFSLETGESGETSPSNVPRPCSSPPSPSGEDTVVEPPRLYDGFAEYRNTTVAAAVLLLLLLLRAGVAGNSTASTTPSISALPAAALRPTPSISKRGTVDAGSSAFWST